MARADVEAWRRGSAYASIHTIHTLVTPPLTHPPSTLLPDQRQQWLHMCGKGDRRREDLKRLVATHALGLLVLCGDCDNVLRLRHLTCIEGVGKAK